MAETALLAYSCEHLFILNSNGTLTSHKDSYECKPGSAEVCFENKWPHKLQHSWLCLWEHLLFLLTALRHFSLPALLWQPSAPSSPILLLFSHSGQVWKAKPFTHITHCDVSTLQCINLADGLVNCESGKSYLKQEQPPWVTFGVTN